MNKTLFALVGALTLLQACSITHAPKKSTLAPPKQWLASSGAGPVERTWWTGFGDPVLTRLIDEALARNLDLRLAAARVAEAKALTDAQRSFTLPTIDLGVGAQRSRSVFVVTGRPILANSATAQFQVAYEVGLWGRLDALVAAAQASTDAAAAARDFVALSVSAIVADAYFNLRSIDAQLELARETLESRARSLALTRSREASGYGGMLETAEAEAAYQATAQVIPQLEMARERRGRGA